MENLKRRQFLKLITGSAIAAALPLSITGKSAAMEFKVVGAKNYNPAFLTLRILQEARCDIELDSFYRWADYCEEQKLFCKSEPWIGGSFLDHLSCFADTGNALIKCEEGVFVAIVLSKLPHGPYNTIRAATCDYTIGVGEEVVIYKGFAYNAIQFPEAQVGDNIYICTKTVYLPPEERRKRCREGSTGEVEAVLAIKAYTHVGY